ncbi:MAG: hypothetical protein SFU83_14105 [Meiothermus sp.]|nr:hypothetical protein [Meiothermus sp.]
MRPFFKALLAGLLSACTGAPLSSGLPETTVPIVSIPTGNLVIFYDTAFEFSRPPISARQIAVEGVAEYQQTPMSVHIYGSTTLPQEGCVHIMNSSLLLCQAAKYARLTKDPISFENAARHNVRLEGEVLTQGVNQGKIWLGAQIAAEIPSQGDIVLKQMNVKVAFF